jgi:hypothetical protein
MFSTPTLHCKVSIFKAILTPGSARNRRRHFRDVSAMSLRGFVPEPTLETAINQGNTYACRGMPTAGPTRKWHGLSLSRRRRLSLSRVPHVCPRGATKARPLLQPAPQSRHARARSDRRHAFASLGARPRSVRKRRCSRWAVVAIRVKPGAMMAGPRSTPVSL